MASETAVPVETDSRRRRGFRSGKTHRLRFERPKELFNLRWNYANSSADETELLCDTTLPDGTSLTFKVFQIEERVEEPLPSSYTYDAKPEGECVGQKITETVADGTASAMWPFPTDDEGEVINPYDPLHWYRERSDLDFGDEDELPENLDDLLMEDDLRPFVFIVEYQDEWAMSPSPASGMIDVELDLSGGGDSASTAEVLTADGEREIVPVAEGVLSKGGVADGPILVHIPNVYFGGPDGG